jgi:hypothetical protein
MKLKEDAQPESALTNEHRPPHEEDLRHSLAGCYPVFESFIERVVEVFPGIAVEWRYSQQTGWYSFFVFRKRRLFYFLPKHRDFRLTVVLGDRALVEFIQSPFAADAQPMLRAARHFPEGTAVSLDKKHFDPDVAIALLRSKLA